MRNCLILGAGRSGTSLTAGALAQAGYFMGDQSYPADLGNPKGYFEDPAINRLNEELLGQVLPERPRGALGSWLFRSRPSFGQRWLAQVPLGTALPASDEIRARMAALTSRTPFCFKDPRFSYTLPAWRPFLQATTFVCVFREPAATAASMVVHWRQQPALRSLAFGRAQALALWTTVYQHVLDQHLPAGGDWLFVHYQQLLDGSAYPRLRDRLQAQVDPTFVDARLNRSRSLGAVPPAADALYERLCALAGVAVTPVPAHVATHGASPEAPMRYDRNAITALIDWFVSPDTVEDVDLRAALRSVPESPLAWLDVYAPLATALE